MASWTADTPGTPAGRRQTTATPRPSRLKRFWPTQRPRLSDDLPVPFPHNGEHELFLSPASPKHYET